jgi:ubiquitin C-terminal hydrolase
MFFKDRFDNGKDSVAKSYISVVEELHSGKKPQVAELMHNFIKEFKYFENMRMQHDSHETTMCILDSLYESLKGNKANFISTIFDSVFENVVQCKDCGHKVVNKETARNICINSNAESIQEGVNATFNEEKMDDYKCDMCSEKDCYRKKTHYRHSYIVMITINMYDNHGRKAKTTMNMDNIIEINGKKYTMYASVCHHGSADNGHYTASVKSDNIWYIIDDETVYEVKDQQNLHLKNAYTLFYKV